MLGPEPSAKSRLAVYAAAQASHVGVFLVCSCALGVVIHDITSR